MRSVRIWFNKIGMIRYISHLDLMRTMMRIVRRAQLPLWYTEGFNPHPYMTFALPLSLGMESECESMDVRVEGEMDNDEIFRRLKAVAPEGITFTAVTEPKFDPKLIAYGEFDILFSSEENLHEIYLTANSLLIAESLVVKKLGKKGRAKVYKEIDLIDMIKSYSLTENENEVRLNVVLPAGSKTNINPALLADEIVRPFSSARYIIRRKRLLTDKMEVFR